MAATIDDVKDKTFDYIICGGGTAGLTLAARLTENPKNSVLVLEAGDANIGAMELLLPASYGSQFGNDQYSWPHQTDIDAAIGPLDVAYPATIDVGELKVQQTFVNAGIPLARKPVNGDPAGTYYAPITYDPKTHMRSYATTAFYLPNKDRPNLTVLSSAYASRVLPSSQNASDFTAEAVEFRHEGEVYTARAAQEIILSAGALKTPQILELSGIGDPAVLRPLNIPVKIDLPGVGANVQEHFTLPISFEIRDDVPFETLDGLSDPEVLKKHLELRPTGRGAFTTGIIGVAFATLAQISPRADEIIKNAEEKIMQNAEKLSPALLEQYKMSLNRLRHGAGCEFVSCAGMVSKPNPAEPGKRYLSIWVAMNHTLSRGTIHSVSNDPEVDPEFDPHYFEQEVDLQVSIEMIKFARNLKNISPLKEMIGMSTLSPSTWCFS
ncbi:GMC oxidoreductase [Trametes cinnabarina]|uniref:GMC oxidoreductase n=1 Tax=Pycnoporus cinnabarinus TaxID=5643 RepID=A0A060SHX1_PYCCI|nr:GMC oxidoreductase [Trametes cinnabarina]